MCGGGGDSRAADAANAAEVARKRQVRDATARIDAAFAPGGQRNDQLREFTEALRKDFRVDAEKQKVDVDRGLKFSLARGGLTGGSAAADAGTKLDEEFQEGLLKGERGVQGALADLASADEASRRNLIALAQGGAGVASSGSAAALAAKSNLEGARTTNLADSIGDLFSDTRGLFVRQQEAAARRRGLSESDLFADPFSRG